jgi:hypothetical protein
MPISFKIILHFFLLFFIVSGLGVGGFFFNFLERKQTTQDSVLTVVVVVCAGLLDIAACPRICVSRLFEEEFSAMLFEVRLAQLPSAFRHLLGYPRIFLLLVAM